MERYWASVNLLFLLARALGLKIPILGNSDFPVVKIGVVDKEKFSIYILLMTEFIENYLISLQNLSALFRLCYQPI
jgi:hypothetical protein